MEVGNFKLTAKERKRGKGIREERRREEERERKGEEGS